MSAMVIVADMPTFERLESLPITALALIVLPMPYGSTRVMTTVRFFLPRLAAATSVSLEVERQKL
jgi:hypothetical protein